MNDVYRLIPLCIPRELHEIIYIYAGTCTPSSKKEVKSIEHQTNHKKHVTPKKNKKELIMDEYQDMKRDLEPSGYTITTDSVNYIYIDNSVKVKFN